MEAPLPPGPRKAGRAPLPTVSLLVGGTLCTLAVALAALRSIAQQLAHDALVMRALGVTLAMGAVMLGRVAMAASAGMRRLAAMAVAGVSLAVALTLLAWPRAAALMYDQGLGAVAPWVIAVPGLLALALSRWRVS